MYEMMNEHCDEVLAELDRISDLPRYLDLRKRLWEVDASTDLEFQHLYRSYWRMNVARLGDPFYSQYFGYLEALKREPMDNPDDSIRDIALIQNTAERPSLQFSFATKLLNTIDPKTPVYDGYVSAFYFFTPRPSDQPVRLRLDELLHFYAFLRGEYARVVDGGLLRVAVARFREHFQIDHTLCDERVIDLLIWGFVSLLRNGAQLQGKALYR